MGMKKSACPVTVFVPRTVPKSTSGQFFEVETFSVLKETRELVMIVSFLQLTILPVIHQLSTLSVPL